MDFIELFHNQHSHFLPTLAHSHSVALAPDLAKVEFTRVGVQSKLNTSTSNSANNSSQLAATSSVSSVSVDDLYLRNWEIFGLPITIVIGLLNNITILFVMPRGMVSDSCIYSISEAKRVGYINLKFLTVAMNFQSYSCLPNFKG